jgi:hypothetical protein
VPLVGKWSIVASSGKLRTEIRPCRALLPRTPPLMNDDDYYLVKKSKRSPIPIASHEDVTAVE